MYLYPSLCLAATICIICVCLSVSCISHVRRRTLAARRDPVFLSNHISRQAASAVAEMMVTALCAAACGINYVAAVLSAFAAAVYYLLHVRMALAERKAFPRGC